MGSSFFTAPLPRVPPPRFRSEDDLDIYSAFAVCRLPLFFLPRRPSFSWLENKLKPFFFFLQEGA